MKLWADNLLLHSKKINQTGTRISGFVEKSHKKGIIKFPIYKLITSFYRTILTGSLYELIELFLHQFDFMQRLIIIQNSIRLFKAFCNYIRLFYSDRRNQQPRNVIFSFVMPLFLNYNVVSDNLTTFSPLANNHFHLSLSKMFYSTSKCTYHDPIIR